MKTILIGINAKYIHTNLAIRLLKANCDYEVDIKEFTIKDDINKIVNFINSNHYELIGLSCYIWNIEYIKQLLNILKEQNIKILLGGPEVSYNANYYIDNYNVDFVIRDEGEFAFNNLMHALNNKEPLNNIPNLSTLDIQNKSIYIDNLKELKSPHYFPNNHKNRISYIEASRGCPFNCAYCMASLEKGVRFFDIDTVKKDIIYLMKQGTKVFKFLDRTFNINTKTTYDLFDFIIKNHYPSTSFQFEITGDILPNHIIEYLNKNAPKNLFRFEIGIQSTNQVSNHLVNRIQNQDVLFDNIKKIQDANMIDLHLDLIAGLPEEDLSSFQKTFDDVLSLRPLELQLGFLKLLRGTKLYNDAKLYNYKFTETAPYEIISSNSLSPDDIEKIKLVENVLEKYYNSQFLTKTINYILDNINSAFDFFLDFGLYFNKNYSWFNYNLDDLFIRLLEYLKLIDFNNYDYISFLMKYDYLNHFKIKPKIWWKRINRNVRNELIIKFQKSILNNYSLDDLYRYALIERYDNLYIIAIYKHNYSNVFVYETQKEE